MGKRKAVAKFTVKVVCVPLPDKERLERELRLGRAIKRILLAYGNINSALLHKEERK